MNFSKYLFLKRTCETNFHIRVEVNMLKVLKKKRKRKRRLIKKKKILKKFRSECFETNPFVSPS
jgi:hypothetical protein